MLLTDPKPGEPNWTICPFTNKRRFETKADAKIMLKRAQKNPNHHKKGRVEKRVGMCDGCWGWHTTSFARRS